MPTKNYLVAVSGGPDSMALLDTTFKGEDNIIVAHVNYGVRDTAMRDQKIVEEYCKQNGIKLFVDDTFNKTDKNFQSQARIHRYEFFKKLVIENKLDGVLVGHHQDDAIETYLFQKKRGSLVDVHGLAFETIVSETKVIRPMLMSTKKQIINYLEENNIKYGIDESNFDPKYQRFAFRQIVNSMTFDERSEIIYEMNQANKLLLDMKLEVKGLLKDYLKDNMLSLEVFDKAINEIVLKRTIFKFLSIVGYPEELIQGSTINEVISFVKKSTQGNSSMDGKAGFKIQLNKKRLKVKHPKT